MNAIHHMPTSGSADVSSKAKVFVNFYYDIQQCNLLLIPKSNISGLITDECTITYNDHYENFRVSDNSYCAISEGAMYHFYFYNCTPQIGDWNIELQRVLVQNVWGLLPKNAFSIMIYEWIETGLYLVLFFCLIINRIHHRKLVLKLHSILIITVLLCFTSSLIPSIGMTISNSVQMGSGFVYANEALRSLRLILISALSLTIASGLSITSEKLSCAQISSTILISLTLELHSLLYPHLCRNIIRVGLLGSSLP